MCTLVIIDAHLLTEMIPEDAKQKAEDENQFVTWIRRGHGKIVYTKHGQYNKEVLDVGSILPALSRLSKAGLTKLIQESDLLEAKKDLRHRDFNKTSDDPHILELSLASGALVLCTKDKELKNDFCRLPKVQRKSRGVYPLGSGKGVRQTFLDRRQCPKIAKK